jgi:CBS domain-containing protein
MKRSIAKFLAVLFLLTNVAFAVDPLPSWNDGPAKKAIVEFVTKVTTAGSPDFVPVPERIATFDNDGTLWCEQPLSVQLYFALERVKALAPQHPEWKTQEPFASLLKGDVQTALAGGDQAVLQLMMIDRQSRTLVGMITDRDLCLSIVAEGLDARTMPILGFITQHPVTCRDGENLEKCKRLMQEHQVRRIPVVDGEDHVIGIVAQADLALKDTPGRVHKTVAEISKSARPSMAA